MDNPLRTLAAIDIEAFQKELISWYEREKRDLPWRKDRDPYKIWVSEIMLQQTRVDTVIPYFNNFLKKFPTLKHLSEADEDTVLKAWEGLGYYSRVRNLHSAVKEVQEKYGGVVPNTREEIRALKGVGPYTAGAILSIAYGIPEPAVDGNVMRVLSRILLIREDIAKPSTRKIFEQAVREMISHENPSAFNQALMEMGALICTPTSPACLLCPVQKFCHAFSEGVQSELPVKTKGKKQRRVSLSAFILTDETGKTVIQKRPDEGLLAGLWEFPTVEQEYPLIYEKSEFSPVLREKSGIDALVERKAGHINHVFSHLVWDIDVYEGRLLSPVPENEQIRIVSGKDILSFAFPVPYQKMVREYYLKENGAEEE